MIRFLASVTTVDEARIALAGGAQLIDAKDPRRGPLGPLAAVIVRDIVDAVQGAAPVSATLGHDLDPEDDVDARCEGLAAAGVTFMKVGVADPAHAAERVRALRSVASRFRIVLVVLADCANPDPLVDCAADVGLHGIMLDTYAKRDAAGRARALRDLMTEAQLAGFVRAAQEHRLLAGLAGGLRSDDVAPLARVGPDVLGFRGGLCAGSNRRGAVELERVSSVRRAIDEAGAGPIRLALGASSAGQLGYRPSR